MRHIDEKYLGAVRVWFKRRGKGDVVPSDDSYRLGQAESNPSRHVQEQEHVRNQGHNQLNSIDSQEPAMPG